jgi:hypothetical protein
MVQAGAETAKTKTLTANVGLRIAEGDIRHIVHWP